MVDLASLTKRHRGGEGARYCFFLGVDEDDDKLGNGCGVAAAAAADVEDDASEEDIAHVVSVLAVMASVSMFASLLISIVVSATAELVPFFSTMGASSGSRGAPDKASTTMFCQRRTIMRFYEILSRIFRLLSIENIAF